MKNKDKNPDKKQVIPTAKGEEYSPVVRRLNETVENPKVEYSNAFVLKGKTLQPFTTDHETAAKISQDKQCVEKKFKSNAEIADIVLNSSKILFGEKIILIGLLKKNSIEFAGGFSADGLLFDFSENGKTRLYIVKITLGSQSLGELFLWITQIFFLFRNNRNKESIRMFASQLSLAINKNIGWRNKLKPYVNGKNMDEFLQEVLIHKPQILLLMDSFRQELNGYRETYDTWEKYLKQMVLRRFAINSDTIITTVPTFSELDKKLNGKKKSSADKVKATEADHLENVSETVKEIFLELKEELLKTDKELEFRVKQYYISCRKKRNLFFLQLGKKKLSIVIANPEKNDSSKIKHYQIRILAPSVRQFWNGNEHCFTVVIESKEHLSEITSLLKKLLFNGESKEKVKSDDPPWEQGDGTLPAESTGSGRKTKSQAKPGVKKSKKR